MKHIFLIGGLFFIVPAWGQDTTMNNLTREMDKSSEKTEKKVVKVFESYRTINANTTEVTGKGKMDFNVTHNFGDIGGSAGGTKSFFGLDAIEDVRIGFNIGLGKRFDLITSRSKGSGRVQHLWQLGAKYQLMQQLENDPSHPLSIAIFGDAVVSTAKKDTLDDQDGSFRNFSDRWSYILQLIVARKIGKVGIQINPTFSTQGYARIVDQKSLFAMGGAIRLPLGGKVNLVLDYFHTFRKKASKDSLATKGFHFHDPIGVGFEILTAGHIFHLNFTNAKEILENRFIPRTTSSWGKGEFRWGFTISRVFVLWREKH